MSFEEPEIKVGDIATFHNSKRKPVTRADRTSGVYRYIGAAGIQDYVDDYLFHGEYVLIGEDGTVATDNGNPYVQKVSGKFWVNNHAHVLTCNNQNDTDFLAYSLSTVHITPYVTGAVQPKLSMTSLKSAPIPWPEKNSRESITQILRVLDQRITNNQSVASNLESIARTIFRAWFVDFEPVKAKAAGATSFPSMPQDVFDALPTTFVDSEIGPVPEGWEVRPINDLVTIKGGGTPSTKNPDFWEGGENCWATPKDLSQLDHPVLLDTDRHITDEGVGAISSRMLPAGTVLLSSRAPVGYLAIANMPTAINQGFIAMICDGDLPATFVLNWAAESMNMIKTSASGTTFAEISKKSFRPLPAVLPNEETITAYRETADPLFQSIAAKIAENHTLSKLRDTLLPRLISGKLRVQDAEQEVSAVV